MRLDSAEKNRFWGMKRTSFLQCVLCFPDNDNNQEITVETSSGVTPYACRWLSSDNSRTHLLRFPLSLFQKIVLLWPPVLCYLLPSPDDGLSDSPSFRKRRPCPTKALSTPNELLDILVNAAELANLKMLQYILNLLRPYYSICPSLLDNENHLHDDGKVDNVCYEALEYPTPAELSKCLYMEDVSYVTLYIS